MKKRNKPQKSYRRDVENEADSGGGRKRRIQESIGSVDDIDPEDLKNRREAEREA